MNSCIETNNTFDELPPGRWRAILQLDLAPKQLAAQGAEYYEVQKLNSTAELPFNFDINYDEKGKMYMTILNGDEKIMVKDVIMGRDRASGKDTFRVDFPLYESYINGFFEEKVMEGNWVVTSKNNYRVPFVAFYGKGERFLDRKLKPNADLTGKWATTFEVDTEDAYPAIGEFTQVGSKLTGTFLTETGDYRYLEGLVQENKFWLSTFDGAHAFLFEGKILEDGSLIGTFRSGKTYTSSWKATRNDNATLTEAFNLSKTVTDAPLSLSLSNTKGELISLDDAQYKGKAKLVQIMGTWCPNCMDEMNFLLDYYKNDKPENLEVIAVAFERYKDTTKAYQILDTYKEKMGVPYEMLYGGYLNKKEASKVFPSLDKIMSYPTLLFVDADNNIQHVHTGFNGPATSKFEQFKTEFAQHIDDITK